MSSEHPFQISPTGDASVRTVFQQINRILANFNTRISLLEVEAPDLGSLFTEDADQFLLEDGDILSLE